LQVPPAADPDHPVIVPVIVVLNIGRLRPGGADYYVGEIASSAEDYYLGHGEAPGRWVGSLAADLGLGGRVEPEHFRNLLEGRHPTTGEQLVAGHREAPVASYVSDAVDDWLTTGAAARQLRCSEGYVRRLCRSGTLVGDKAASGDTGNGGWRVRRSEVNRYAAAHTKPRSRPGYDVTLRPPKSVSVLWALGDERQRAVIRQAHREAVNEVVRYLEAQATFCRTKGDRILTDGLVAAAFDHRTSRAGDPLLHTHVVIANLSHTVAGTWRALDGRPLYDHGISGGHLYQAHLRHLLTKRLGVAWGPMQRGWAEVDGVPRVVIDEFSQRRDEIEQLLAESGYDSARARQTATLATRQAKNYQVTPDSLAGQWRERATEAGFGPEAVAACFDRDVAAEPRDFNVTLCRLGGPCGVTERASTFTRRDVIRWLANDADGGLHATDIQHAADVFLASDQAVPLNLEGQRGRSQLVLGSQGRPLRTAGLAVFTTPEIITLEARLFTLAGADAPPASTASTAAVTRALADRGELSGEQQQMVRAVSTSRAAILPVVGRPGSGKTYATEACVAALRAGGVPAVGCAVSATAAAELQAAAGLHSTTVASLVSRLDRGDYRLDPHTVVILDEASMAGTRDLARLARHATSVGGRIVLVGDPDQHAPVDCGGVFRYLANRPGVLSLVENNRQEDPVERLAIDEYRQGRIADALARYDDSGRVVRCSTAGECYDAMVADWYVAWNKGETDPMIAGPNSTRRALNSRARRLLKAEGHLTGPALSVAGLEFMAGDLVVARRNDRTLHALRSRSFVKNGSAGRVAAVDLGAAELVVAFDKEGTVRIPADYLAGGHLEHGYARTTYLTQGATHGTGRYHPTDSARFEEGYVALTRARHQTRIYVVEGDNHVTDETGHGQPETDEVGLDTITSSMTRRSTNTTAHSLDPATARVTEQALRLSLDQLQAQRSRLQATLWHCPPDKSAELAPARRELDAINRSNRPWSSRLNGKVEQRVRTLEAAQARHDTFRTEHADDYATLDVTEQAITTVRLRSALSKELQVLDWHSPHHETGLEAEIDHGLEW